MLDAALAAKFQRIALGHVARTYPSSLMLRVGSPDDIGTPDQLTPIFYGSFDWHSCVHGYWTLARLKRLFPKSPESDATAALFASAASAQQPNVLLIVVDDLRPALGCYGDAVAKTPNIDAFASTARVFDRAYCQQAVCGPSRASLLTGRLPDNLRVWHNRNLFRATQPDLVTLPQHFKNHGYHTAALGKVFSGDERELDPASWSEPEIIKQPGWRNSLVGKSGQGKGAAWEAADVADDGYLQTI